MDTYEISKQAASYCRNGLNLHLFSYVGEFNGIERSDTSKDAS